MSLVGWAEYCGYGHCDQCAAFVTVRKYGPPYGSFLLCGGCHLKARLALAAMEMEQRYAEWRWEQYTGRKAALASQPT